MHEPEKCTIFHQGPCYIHFMTTELKMPETIEEIARDYIACGGLIRRKDASPKSPSPVLSAMDVVQIALAQKARELVK